MTIPGATEYDVDIAFDKAVSVGAKVVFVDAYLLSTDVDEREDLVEVLLHGRGLAREWLQEAGFEIAVDEDEGRVDVNREK